MSNLAFDRWRSAINNVWHRVAGAFSVLVKGFDGANYNVINVDSDGHVQVDVLSGGGGGGGGTEYTEGTDVVAAGEGTLVLAKDPADSNIGKGLNIDPSGNLYVNVAAGGTAGGATEITLSAINTKLVSGTDIGDVTINNGAAGAAVNIQDGGNTITVDGTVAVSSVAGNVACNTELPSAVALTDNMANPTAPAVAAHEMVWDGSTWDRAPGTSADGALVNLGTNNDVTVTSGTVTANIAAGTNNIGDVDVLSLPAIPAGTNNIGDVDIASTPGATLTAATTTPIDATALTSDSDWTLGQILDNGMTVHILVIQNTSDAMLEIGYGSPPTTGSGNGISGYIGPRTAITLDLKAAGIVLPSGTDVYVRRFNEDPVTGFVMATAYGV